MGKHRRVVIVKPAVGGFFIIAEIIVAVTHRGHHAAGNLLLRHIGYIDAEQIRRRVRLGQQPFGRLHGKFRRKIIIEALGRGIVIERHSHGGNPGPMGSRRGTDGPRVQNIPADIASPVDAGNNQIGLVIHQRGNGQAAAVKGRSPYFPPVDAPVKMLFLNLQSAVDGHAVGGPGIMRRRSRHSDLAQSLRRAGHGGNARGVKSVIVGQ